MMPIKRSKRSFKPGELIFSSKPFIAVLDRRCKFERCDFCFSQFPPYSSPLPRPLTCPECSACLYCNEECRDQAFRDHEKECHYLRQKGKSLISDTGRFMMKLILKTQEHVIQKCENGSSSNDDQLKPANSAASASKAGNGNGARKSYQLDEFLSDIGIKRNFTQLKSHYHEMIRDQDRLANIAGVYEELAAYNLEELPEDEETFIRLCGKVLINSFNYTDEHNQRIGTALYLAASILDHSCVPNATFTFDKGQISLRSLEALTIEEDQPVQEVVRISYIDLMDSTANRRRRLKQHYYFDCNCPRCSDLMSHEWQMYSLACGSPGSKCKSPIFVGMANSSSSSGDSDSKSIDDLSPTEAGCKECGWKPDQKCLEDYLSVWSSVSKLLNTSPAPFGTAALDDSLTAMSGLLHPEHFLYTKAAKRAFEDHNKRKNYKKAHQNGMLCLNSYRKFKTHVWPSLAQLLLKLGRLELFHLTCSMSLTSPSSSSSSASSLTSGSVSGEKAPHLLAKDHLAEALGIIHITHGKEHPLFEEAKNLYEDAKSFAQKMSC